MSDAMPWVACEHPERPPGPGMSYHLGFIRWGDDKSPCRGCVLAMTAAEMNGHPPHPGVKRLVLTDGPV